ncbi:MAG: tRNA pseudouridine(38-40) synthase TruA [Cyclobacteriaceae bacterium]
MRYFLDVSYDGTAFHGYQIQPNALTVQEVLEKSISTLLRNKTSVLASGRTDTGVHAIQQVIHFDSAEKIDPDQFAHKLNGFLPKTISINDIKPVKAEAHARFDAEKRFYEYKMHKKKNPFAEGRSLHVPYPLDLEKIEAACEIILNTRNFQALSKVHTEVNHFECEIFAISWQSFNDDYLFTVKANRFLRGMIRAMVGTLLEIGQGRMSLERFQEVLTNKNRSDAGKAVAPEGLYLKKIEYPAHIYISQ